METNTTENQPGTAGSDGRRGWGAAIAAGIVVFVLVVLLALPGFLAAGFSRIDDKVVFCINGRVVWDSYRIRPEIPLRYNLMIAILKPSGWLMGQSVFIQQFYNWEYSIAGGRIKDMM